MMRLFYFVLLAAMWLGQSAVAQTGKIESYSLEAGTLESIPAPGLGWVYRAESGKEEVYGFKGALENAYGRGFRPIADLEEVGFQLNTGPDVYYPNEPLIHEMNKTQLDALKQHPGAKIAATIFRGIGNSTLVIPRKGRVDVLRAEIVIQGSTRTLWAIRKTEQVAK